MNPSEIASKEFPVVMRGYLREEVQAFLAGISDQIAARDNRIAQLDAEVARLRQEAADKPAAAAAPAPAAQSAPAAAPALDRPALLRLLGEEAANILACADASAERIKAQAGITTERVRSDLRTIGSSLADVHQLLGELLSLVQGLTEGANLLAATAVEGNSTADGTTTAAGGSTGSGGEEVRTVLGEVLGLDNTQAQEISIPDEAHAEGTAS
ncbi:MAG TPA: DivIVA domain-containing protein [Acidimicrobiia bacterium]|nr:DivIVA domain-containing protein [Acidimicrobiia bacterium]